MTYLVAVLFQLLVPWLALGEEEEEAVLLKHLAII